MRAKSHEVCIDVLLNRVHPGIICLSLRYKCRREYLDKKIKILSTDKWSDRLELHNSSTNCDL